MKRLLPILLALLFLVGAAGAGQFEGKIEMKITTDDGAGTMESILYTMYISSGRIAAELHGEGEYPVRMKSIFDPAKGTLWVVDDGRKTFVEIPVQNGNPLMGEGDTAGTGRGRPPVGAKKIKTESLLGQKCEVWEFTGEGDKTTIWGASGYVDLVKAMSHFIMSMGSLFGEDGDAAWRLVKEKKLLPLKSVTITEDGVKETQEITKIERRKVQGAIFEIPQGYARQESLVPFQMEGDTTEEDESDEPQ